MPPRRSARADQPTDTARPRARRVVAALVSTALALAGAVLLVTAPLARPAAAASRVCPAPGDMPNISQLPPQFMDSNVTVFAGGDFVATGGAAESEGLHVVRGDARFTQYRYLPRTFNLGTVGVGSQITPGWGEPMLQVGGDIHIVDRVTVSVGFGHAQRGGAVRAGGKVTGGGRLDTNSGTLSTGLGATAALAPWHGFHDVITDTSATLAAVPATGTAVRSSHPERVTLTSAEPGNTTLQAFTIDAADLDGATEFVLAGIPENAPVVINVVGGERVDVRSNYVRLNGQRVDVVQNIGNAASQLLWNFTSATAVNVRGTGEWVGSVLAPEADVEFTSSTNGRVLVGGDLTTRGVGHEFHSFPWIGPGPFGCIDGETEDEYDGQYDDYDGVYDGEYCYASDDEDAGGPDASGPDGTDDDGADDDAVDVEGDDATDEGANHGGDPSTDDGPTDGERDGGDASESDDEEVVVAGGGWLPVTGAEATLAAVAALLLVGAGTALLIRRRRSS